MSEASKSGSTRLNLEQQKKRAKELLRAHRRAELEAGERVLRHLPRAQGLSPTAALAIRLALTEAQHIVAREAGFSSFLRMKREIELERGGLDRKLEAIFDAALSGNLEQVERALAAAPGALQRSLHAAAALGDADNALGLLEQNPSLAQSRAGLRGWSPLFYTCAGRYRRDDARTSAARARIAQRLLELGADANEEIASLSAHGGFRSALEAAACDAASPELVGVLLDAHARLEQSGGAAGRELPLTEAVAGGNTACVERLLQANPRPWQLREALEVAVEKDSPPIAGLLLAHGAPPDGAGRWWGQHGSCLHAAILLGRRRELLETLLASDVDLALTDRDGRTAYALAVRTGHDDARELLRARGSSDAELSDLDRAIAACVTGDSVVDPALKAKYRRTDHQVLCWAIRRERYDAVPRLLAAGLDPKIADDHGETPLHLAARAGHAATIAALEAAGASRLARNFAGETPFNEHSADEERAALFENAVKAVVDGDLERLGELLDDEPELVHQRSRRAHRATLLHYVGANGVERQETPKTAAQVAELLLERGADVDALCHTYGGGPGQTTLGLTVTSTYPEQAGLMSAIVQVLVRHGAAVDGLDGEGGPLQGAVSEGQRSAVRALLDAGARIPTLGVAAAVGDLAALDEFARAASTREIVGALISAACFDQAAAVERLLDLGADIAGVDEQKCTALHFAGWCASERAMDVLLRRGAPLEAINVYGGNVIGMTVHSSLYGRRELDHARVIARLCRAGADFQNFNEEFAAAVRAALARVPI